MFFQKRHVGGGAGRIYAFEPMPQNYDMLAVNAEKIANLEIYNVGLGKEEGTLKFTFPEWGAASGSSRYDENGDVEVNIVTLDRFVAEKKIEKVDFIKADIEGAECDMLLGAAETIRKFHPKLAICIYHRGQTDHYKVPETILSIRQDYEFYLEAYLNGLNETVLFAVPVDYQPERRQPSPKTVTTVKELYKAVQDRLRTNYQTTFFKEFSCWLDRFLKCHFEWKTINRDNRRMFLNNSGAVHYKLFFMRNGVDVLLVFDRFETYKEVHKVKIRELLDRFLETHVDYTLTSNQYGIYICKHLSVQWVTPENAACNMAVLMKETMGQLWKAGVIDPECIKQVFSEADSIGREFL